MSNYFETTVKFKKTIENGTVKTVSEPYLVPALSFAEAEARTIKEVKPYISGDFTVKAVKITKIAEVFRSTAGGYWYQVKAAFSSLDENSGEDKKNNVLYMVQSADFDGACDFFKESMKGTLADYEIVSVVLTKILDVFS